jgi:aminoglycoside phosphotransferase (APT) family kinase protein
VFSDTRLTGVIDFDYASPGPRSWDLAYLAYRLAPLTGWTEPDEPAGEIERSGRVSRLLAAYGIDLSVAELLPIVVARLAALADFSESAAVQLDKPELAEHAAGYRADAGRLASRVLP